MVRYSASDSFSTFCAQRSSSSRVQKGVCCPKFSVFLESVWRRLAGRMWRYRLSKIVRYLTMTDNVQRGSMWSEETASFTLEESLHLVYRPGLTCWHNRYDDMIYKWSICFAVCNCTSPAWPRSIMQICGAIWKVKRQSLGHSMWVGILEAWAVEDGQRQRKRNSVSLLSHSICDIFASKGWP